MQIHIVTSIYENVATGVTLTNKTQRITEFSVFLCI